MTEYRHIGCKSMVFRYHGTEPLTDASEIRAQDWTRADGSQPKSSDLMIDTCPDCGARVYPFRRSIEPIPSGPEIRREFAAIDRAFANVPALS